ncbi:DUF669 domain-containing protein [Solibacillus cecembensis]|uniref:DUF669 domain-containing protein n=1 Tax=Solibacillus cecembensis TaxID=459347 RepID=UPI003D068247
MGFKIDFDENNVLTGEFELVAEGKYEATILNAKAEEFQGNWNIGFDVEIRSDVTQKHQGAKVLYNTLYLSSSNPEYKESTEKKRNSFFVACGYKGKQSLDLEQVVNEIIGKAVYVYIKHRTKNDKTFPHVTFVAESKVNPPVQQGAPIVVGEDDLPF